MNSLLPLALLASAAAAAPVHEEARRDTQAQAAWDVNNFEARVYAGSLTQLTTFTLARPGSEETIKCANATGAAISSEPFLRPVADSPCSEGSPITFSFTQVEERAVELRVSDAGGWTGTFASEPAVVSSISRGPGPNDYETAYVGPHAFGVDMAAPS